MEDESMLEKKVRICKDNEASRSHSLSGAKYCPYSIFQGFICEFASIGTTISFKGRTYRFCEYPVVPGE